MNAILLYKPINCSLGPLKSGARGKLPSRFDPPLLPSGRPALHILAINLCDITPVVYWGQGENDIYTIFKIDNSSSNLLPMKAVIPAIKRIIKCGNFMLKTIHNVNIIDWAYSWIVILSGSGLLAQIWSVLIGCWALFQFCPRTAGKALRQNGFFLSTFVKDEWIFRL